MSGGRQTKPDQTRPEEADTVSLEMRRPLFVPDLLDNDNDEVCAALVISNGWELIITGAAAGASHDIPPTFLSE